MEIKININQNDYSQPKEIRENVVQGICDAFINGCISSVFHPYNDGCYRNPTIYIWKWKTSTKFIGFESSYNATDSFAKEKKDVIRINGEEMKTAFQVLIKAGYHIFKIYEFGSWLGYKLSKKPFLQDGYEVFSFDDFID